MNGDSESQIPGLRLPVIAVWLGRIELAGIYLAAAWPKIGDPAGFGKSIAGYQLLPDAAISPLAIFLPWLELFTALALLFFAPLRRGALWLLGAMTTVFIVAIGSAVARGIDIDCGCFSTTGQGARTGWLHIFLDAALLGLCIMLARVGSARNSGAHVADRPAA